MSARILMIDNYDSFTFNLVQGFRGLGAQVMVHRNDQLSLDEAQQMPKTHVVISPGPGNPDSAGISVELIRATAGSVPVLGVCLGHQSIVAAFGGTIERASRQMHGKTSTIEHDGKGVFASIESPFVVGRYHSLTAVDSSLPDELYVTSRTDQNEIMGVRHREYAIEGVQFHPESVLTPEGLTLMNNFLSQEAA